MCLYRVTGKQFNPGALFLSLVVVSRGEVHVDALLIVMGHVSRKLYTGPKELRKRVARVSCRIRSGHRLRHVYSAAGKGVVETRARARLCHDRNVGDLAAHALRHERACMQRHEEKNTN